MRSLCQCYLFFHHSWSETPSTARKNTRSCAADFQPQRPAMESILTSSRASRSFTFSNQARLIASCTECPVIALNLSSAARREQAKLPKTSRTLPQTRPAGSATAAETHTQPSSPAGRPSSSRAASPRSVRTRTPTLRGENPERDHWDDIVPNRLPSDSNQSPDSSGHRRIRANGAPPSTGSRRSSRSRTTERRDASGPSRRTPCRPDGRGRRRAPPGHQP